jgi:hypothetical protein
MIDVTSKIARLKELLKLKEVETAESPVTVDSEPETTSSVVDYSQEEFEQHGNNLCLDKQKQRPASLRGLSSKAILLMQHDGLLSEQEQQWLAMKNPLDENGWPNFPNIQVLQRVAKAKSV